MKSAALPLLLGSFCVIAASTAPAIQPPTAGEKFRPVDTILLKNGSSERGLIVKNTASEVILQQEMMEISIPKKSIERILDLPDTGMEFTDTSSKGDFPSWRVIVNDLRSNDRIHDFREIPAVRMSAGHFRNVPYKSFRINNKVEFNVYGNPEDPAGLEFGVYGLQSFSSRTKKLLRSYLAGFLTTREEIAALYAVDLAGGSANAGDIRVEITPRGAPEAFGAWWISIYNSKEMAKVRLTDQEYSAITLPASEVLAPFGRLKKKAWTKAELGLAPKMEDDADEIIQRGFYRDKDGVFRVLGQ